MPVKENSKMKAAKVFTSNGWGFIDEKGKEIIPAIYESISDFRHGLVSAKLIIPLPTTQDGRKRTELRTDLLTYTGKRLNGEKSFVMDFKNLYYYQKDFFQINENNYQGMMSIAGKILVPFKYESIEVDDDYFFAYFPVKNNNYNERIADIYSRKGKLIKSIKGNSLQKVYNKFFVPEYDKDGNRAGCFSLNSKTFEREKKYEFQIFNTVENSKLFEKNNYIRKRKRHLPHLPS